MSLYNKNAGEDVDDVWDDTELIRMYEESISTTYNKLKVPKENIEKKSFTTEEGVTYEWKVGAKCMAPFIEEGEVFWYPATISWIAGGENRDVGVTFDGYGNTENVDIKDIWEESEAMDAEESATPNPKSHGPSKRSTPKIPCIAPPPPPGALNFAPPEESEALSSMLMSWYMSGYHTGYYQALADQKAKRGSSTRN